MGVDSPLNRHFAVPNLLAAAYELYIIIIMLCVKHWST